MGGGPAESPSKIKVLNNMFGLGLGDVLSHLSLGLWENRISLSVCEDVSTFSFLFFFFPSNIADNLFSIVQIWPLFHLPM